MKKTWMNFCALIIYFCCINSVNAQIYNIKDLLSTSKLVIEKTKIPLIGNISYYTNKITDFPSINKYSLEKEINDGFGNKGNNQLLMFSVGYKLDTEPIKIHEHFFSFSPKVGQANSLHYACFGNSINYRYKSLLVSADYTYLIDLDIFSRSHDSFHLLGISAGKRFIKNRLLFDLQLGPGMNWYKRTGYEDTNSAIGLNLKSALKYFPNNKFAIGIDALVSFNKLENLYALPLFSIEYGIMR